MKILLLIIDYNNIDMTVTMVDSIRHPNITPEIHIIDNGSLNHQKYRRYAFPDNLKHRIRICPLSDNAGYFGAVAKHLERVNPSAYDWIFISNNDIVFKDHRIFDYLTQIEDANPSPVGVYCPSVLSGSTGANQNPYLKREPSKLYHLKLKIMLSNFFIASLYETISDIYHMCLNKRFNKRKEGSKPESIFAPHGSFIGLSRAFFT